jgi:structural maintenance of chromosome 1
LIIIVLIFSCFFLQAQNTHTTLLDQIGELALTVNAAEDGVFQGFCRKIKVSNIREYEERQMKVAQEESKARLQYETQISRLTHQYVSFPFGWVGVADWTVRSEFEAEGLKTARERLVNLDTALANERATLEKWELQKVGVQQEITVLEETIAGLKEELGEIQEELEDKNKVVEQVKKTTLKASKVLDFALKEIANCVSGFLQDGRMVD